MSDTTNDEAAGIGAADPITGEAGDLVTNDAVAGETVLPGQGDGNDGPTGGSPAELTPAEPDHAIDPGSIDLDDER